MKKFISLLHSMLSINFTQFLETVVGMGYKV